ncbi:MAG: hypothetical protein CMQ19_00520 [Gammaproteobacteria bacterium]|jgi:hypothetical protein|nr:hypothetical protein [Gammaproteobacteria bacterium]|tara:strand:- start:2633 stop:2989 length:357 start_codon:yes stop_codon:yes gene_type:complete
MNGVEEAPSITFKLKFPEDVLRHAMYFTIVGGEEPTALFINCKEMDAFQWITALMTSYSRQLHRGVSIGEIAQDMCETFAPNGRYIIPDGSGRGASSVVHHLGIVLQDYIGDNTLIEK